MSTIKQGRINISDTEYNPDGTVKREWKRYSLKVNKENFFMTYIETISSLWGLNNANDRKVLDCLCSFADYNTGIAFISYNRRKDIESRLNITSQQISNSLNNLKKNGIIVGDRGEYAINPNLFWRGNDEERLKMLASNNWNLVLTIELKESK